MNRIAVGLLCCSVVAFSASLTADESELVLMLVSHFGRSFCMLGTSQSSKMDWPRTLSEDVRFFVSVMTLDQIHDYMVNVNKCEWSARRSAIVLKAENESYSFLKKVSQTTSLSSVTWIMLSNKPLIKEDFRDIYIPFNCEFVFVNFAAGMYFLTEPYRVTRSSGLETVNFGSWSKVSGLFVRGGHLYKRRKSLMGHVFNATAKIVPPYTIIEGEDGQFGGYLYRTWSEIEHRMNFKSKLSMKEDPSLVNEGGYEFALMPIAYDASVLDRMDLTLPIYESRSYLFGHRPGSELQWDSYLKPFDTKTWWASLGWMACSSLALATLYKIAWVYGTSEREADYFIFTLSESLATVFRAMCMQGSDVTPKSISCRLLFLSIYLTALVVSSAFSAALFSLLTVPVSRPPFNDFEDVLKNKAYRIGLMEGNELETILQDFSSKYPSSIQSKLLQRANVSDRQPSTLFEGLDRVCRNKMYVMMSELPYALYSMKNMTIDCQERIMPAGPVLLRTFIGIGLRKGSPYKELIDLHILKMRNEGIIKRLLLNSWPPEIPTVQAVWVRVTLSDISPILYMFTLGVVLAVLLLAYERLRHSLRCGYGKTRMRDLRGNIWRKMRSMFRARKPETKANTGKNL